MGLTLHYTFRMRDMKRLPEFVHEVEDICQSLNWDYHLWDEIHEAEAAYFPLETIENGQINLRGILFSPPECEPAFFTFTPAGWTCSFIHLQTAPQVFEILPRLVYSMHTKTQYAGEDVHIALVTLFKYLEKKYFDETSTSVSDEGEYWETLDKNILHQCFERYTAVMNFVAAALENAEWTVTDNPHKIADQLEEILKKKLGAEGE